MSLFAKIVKAGRLALHPRFAQAALFSGVAAATEHLSVIRHTKPATLLDIGANKGQFSLAVRVIRPRARIMAFEPLPDAAKTYATLFRGDKLTELHQAAISKTDGTAKFHVTNQRDSSSLLKPGAAQDQAYGVRLSSEIEVRTSRLDKYIDFQQLERPILLKIDVQGAELDVLQGCDRLDLFDYIYVELSFITLYEEQPLYADVAAYLSSHGFEVAGVFHQSMTKEFGPTQADVLFKRVDA